MTRYIAVKLEKARIDIAMIGPYALPANRPELRNPVVPPFTHGVGSVGFLKTTVKPHRVRSVRPLMER